MNFGSSRLGALFLMSTFVTKGFLLNLSFRRSWLNMRIVEFGLEINPTLFASITIYAVGIVTGGPVILL
jgi:hypothetical protein